MRGSLKLNIPTPRIDRFKTSLKYSSTILWNNLPSGLQTDCSLYRVRVGFLQHLLRTPYRGVLPSSSTPAPTQQTCTTCCKFSSQKITTITTTTTIVNSDINHHVCTHDDFYLLLLLCFELFFFYYYYFYYLVRGPDAKKHD